MPNPSSTIGRPELSVLLEDFDLEMDRGGFIGLKLFPRFDAARSAANGKRIKLASLLEIRNTNRAADGGYNQADFQFEDWVYSCNENGLEMKVDAAKREMFANFFDAEVVATELTYDAVLRNQERRIAAAIFNTTTFATVVTFDGSGNTTGNGNTLVAGKAGVGNANVKWTAKATATPINDVLEAQNQVYSASGLWPDTVALSRKLFKQLRQCQQIIDRIKYTKNPDTMTASDIAQAFDIAEVLVAGGSKNTADAGQAAVAAQIWDPTMCIVGKVAKKMTSPWDPGIGRTFYWTGDGGETVETYYSNEKRADMVRVRHATHENMMYSQAGCLIQNCA